MPEENVIKRLILADGTVLDDCECGYADKQLWCYLRKLTFNQVFQLFSDPELTKEIIFEYGIEGNPVVETYSGFTNIKNISRRELTIDVCLEKEAET